MGGSTASNGAQWPRLVVLQRLLETSRLGIDARPPMPSETASPPSDEVASLPPPRHTSLAPRAHTRVARLPLDAPSQPLTEDERRVRGAGDIADG